MNPQSLQRWLEMPGIRKRFYDSSVRIPVKARQTIIRIGDWGNTDFKEEYFGSDAMAVPITMRVEAEKYEWMDLGLRGVSRGFKREDGYVPAYLIKDYESALAAEKLVVESHGLVRNYDNILSCQRRSRKSYVGYAMKGMQIHMSTKSRLRF